jgi:hypothetical protein
LRPSLFKIGIGLTVLGMIWLSFVFYEGDRTMENFSIKSSDSTKIQMYFEGKDIGYYKIFMPEFSGEGVFVQILDQNDNVISDGIVETKMSVGYFDFEQNGIFAAKITNLSNDQINLEVELGDTNGREMIMPGIVTLAGGLIIVVTLYIKLRDYRIEQPDEKIS